MVMIRTTTKSIMMNITKTNSIFPADTMPSYTKVKAGSGGDVVVVVVVVVIVMMMTMVLKCSMMIVHPSCRHHAVYMQLKAGSGVGVFGGGGGGGGGGGDSDDDDDDTEV